MGQKDLAKLARRLTQHQRRALESRPVAAEDIGFPFAAEAALVTRQHVGRKDETVGLITDFQAAMGEDNLTMAFALVTHSHQPII